MKITHLVIKNFQGIEALETDVSPSGAVVAGRNGGGKTSVIRALQAALAARGIDDGAIRIGADKAEILVNLDDISVRRVITPKTSKVTVTNSEGFTRPSPQTFLDDLLGTSALDPVSLFMAPAKERRKQILSTLPVTVTLEELKQWVPTLPDNFNVSGHGLEVIERVREIAYKKRTEANADAKAKRADADRALDEATAAKKDLPASPPSIAEAGAAEEQAKAHRAALIARRNEHAAAVERTAGAREKAVKLRAEADAISIPQADEDAASKVSAEWDELGERIEKLRTDLAAAEQHHRYLGAKLDDYASTRERAAKATKTAEDLRSRAAMIEETLGSVASNAPDEAELAAAQAAVEAAEGASRVAVLAENAGRLAAKATEVTAVSDAAEKEAARLDAMVKALSNDAPAALLARANGIPGLSLSGDEVMLDGKSLDRLCQNEQLKFCVEIAKRLNTKTKIILVDGLERIDPEQMDAFIEFATEGGYQLLATRVDRGDVRIESIERDEAREAAE